MKLLRSVQLLGIALLVTLVVAVTVAGQGQAPARGTPPPPPAVQPGHPSGKLVIWGDLASFDNPATLPTHCILTSRFKRGQRVGIRMTAIDGGSGDVENTAVLVAHITYGGKTVDVPMRWRGVGNFPAAEYPRQPSEMWTGAWPVPMDAPVGPVTYTVTATDRFGRTATFSPFINVVAQLTIVE